MTFIALVSLVLVILTIANVIPAGGGYSSTSKPPSTSTDNDTSLTRVDLELKALNDQIQTMKIQVK